MNLLLICPKYFGYDDLIRRAIIKRGYIVDSLSDRPYDSNIAKVVYRYGMGALLPIATQFYERAVAGFERSHYEKILIIQGEGVSSEVLQMLKRVFPKAKLIYYTWDNLKNKPTYILSNLKYYDKVFSFDEFDSNKYGFVYRPLFFEDRGCHQTVGSTNYCKKNFDLSFIGTVHSDRVKIIKRLKYRLGREGFNFFSYLYVQAGWVFYTRRLFDHHMWGDKLSEYNSRPLSPHAVRTVFDQSRAILDIEHPDQTGLTMRSIEAVGAKRKIITTNPAMLDLDIYKPDNIQIISRSNPEKIDVDFFNKPYVPLLASVTNKYHIDTWVFDVII